MTSITDETFTSKVRPEICTFASGARLMRIVRHANPDILSLVSLVRLVSLFSLTSIYFTNILIYLINLPLARVP